MWLCIGDRNGVRAEGGRIAINAEDLKVIAGSDELTGRRLSDNSPVRPLGARHEKQAAKGIGGFAFDGERTVEVLEDLKFALKLYAVLKLKAPRGANPLVEIHRY